MANSLTEFSTTYKPFHYPWAMKLAEEHESIHWIEQEVELGDDVAQWNSGRLSTGEKDFVLQIMRLFTQTDVQVGQNYCDNFIPYFKNNEIRNMLLSFGCREGIHQRAYALFTDTLGLPETIYSEFLEFDAMVEKMEFMQRNSMESPEDAAKAVAQTVINEGMSLFSSFVMLLNFQRYGKLLGLCKITEWSLRDETAHVEGMAKLFQAYMEEQGFVYEEFKSEILDMVNNALQLEDTFIDEAFELGEPEGITKVEMKKYIRFIADRRLMQLGFEPVFNVENPFPWLDWILAEGMTNFFEQRVSDYSVGGLKGEWKY